jgi:hypothetical protein
MLMTGFRRSLMHNEFRSKTPRLRAIRESDNSENEKEDSFYRMRTLRNKPKKKTYSRSRKYKLKFKSRA